MAGSEPTDAFVAGITLDEDEIVFLFGTGDHTCQRWRVTEDQLRDILADAVPWVLARR